MQSTVQQNQTVTKPVTQHQVQPQLQTAQVQTPVQSQQVQQPQIQQAYVTQPAINIPPQNPNYAGVNIQIFNPSVGTPGSVAPVYNVNAPTYSSAQPASGCYPSNYYTQQFNNPAQLAAQPAQTQPPAAAETKKEEPKKTEKRQIVQLTDEYIKTLENYLNNQDKEVRLMGAKEVVARLQEDESRKDDPALTALVNKMLQDPYQPVKMLALGVLDSRQCTGNDYTVGVLQKMQSGQTGYGQDAKTATNILLKMAGKTVEKEFEVKDQPKKTEEKK